jgi:hypothetical protein
MQFQPAKAAASGQPVNHRSGKALPPLAPGLAGVRKGRMTDAPTDDTPPDHLSNDPRSPHYNAEALARDVGIRFKGVEKTNVEEYCVSENWIRAAVGNAKDRHGNPLTIKFTGTVEPYYKTKKPA